MSLNNEGRAVVTMLTNELLDPPSVSMMMKGKLVTMIVATKIPQHFESIKIAILK